MRWLAAEVSRNLVSEPFSYDMIISLYNQSSCDHYDGEMGKTTIKLVKLEDF